MIDSYEKSKAERECGDRNALGQNDGGLSLTIIVS